MSDTNEKTGVRAEVESAEGASVPAVIKNYPHQLDGDLYLCGTNSPDGYTGDSYFLRHQDGNWLVNTPKYDTQMAKKLESLGGVKYIFLTHRDDGVDAEKFAKHFDAKRIVHRNDVEAHPTAEVILAETETYDYQKQFTLIPSPGHTEGHMMLLFGNQYLFSGDSLYYEHKNQRLELWSPDWTWYSYEEQTMSMEKLLPLEFRWLLPNHGGRIELPVGEMKQQLQEALDRAWSHPDPDLAHDEKVDNLRVYAKSLLERNQPEYAKLITVKADWLSTLVNK